MTPASYHPLTPPDPYSTLKRDSVSQPVCDWCGTTKDQHFKGWLGTLFCHVAGGDHTWHDRDTDPVSHSPGPVERWFLELRAAPNAIFNVDDLLAFAREQDASRAALVSALKFCASVIEKGGAWDMSEKMALEKAEAALSDEGVK